MKDPHLDFTAPADGDYFLAVEHLQYWFGPEEVYRVTVAPYSAGFRPVARHRPLQCGGQAVRSPSRSSSSAAITPGRLT